ncbi:MAG: amidohydrolase [Chloroflexi bacterium]|nr:amidohydrolase [Chloroflexota bacterium]
MSGLDNELGRAPELILISDNVVTLCPALPRARAVAVRCGSIIAVGSVQQVISLATPQTVVVECPGKCVVPGFHDAHIHLVACAKKRLIVDCSPPGVASVRQIQSAIKERVQRTPVGDWIRAGNYDEFWLAEKRHPTRYDLDAVAPDNPVRLEHRSLHACVLNTLALRVIGIEHDVCGSSEARIEVDPYAKRPTGLIYEHQDLLRSGVLPPAGEGDLSQSLYQVLGDLLRSGITSVHDASSNNGMHEWDRFRNLSPTGFRPRIGFMIGYPSLEEFVGERVGPGFGDQWLEFGHVKLMLTEANGSFHPAPEELESAVLRAHSYGFPVAIHAVDESAICVAIEALKQAKPAGGSRDRIEHCSILPPLLLKDAARTGVMVATQPGFLFHHGDRYLEDVERHLQSWLYPIKSLLRSGIVVGAGSDAPVAPPIPLQGIGAAVTRLSREGHPVAKNESISPEKALELFTIGAARVCGQEGQKGSIEPGKLADLVVLSSDPTTVDPNDIDRIEVEMTIVGGRVVWDRQQRN